MVFSGISFIRQPTPFHPLKTHHNFHMRTNLDCQGLRMTRVQGYWQMEEQEISLGIIHQFDEVESCQIHF